MPTFSYGMTPFTTRHIILNCLYAEKNKKQHSSQKYKELRVETVKFLDTSHEANILQEV